MTHLKSTTASQEGAERQSESARPTVHSVNVSGTLRAVRFQDRDVITGFYKIPRSGPAYAHRLGIDGDAQGDRTVHGGLEKAVYFYSLEHYSAWEELLGSGPLTPGSFGENITTKGLLEGDVYIGDILRIGTATLQVIQPRSPCYKLQMRFGRPDMTALFFRQSKPGWYASVLQDGFFSAQDGIILLRRAPDSITVADVWRYSAEQTPDTPTRERIQASQLLPDFWKLRIARR